jgi:hypothetical protein
MKTISALAIVAILGLTLPAPAFAQQTVGANGQVLDGMGNGGNVANHYRFDGPPNADVTSLTTSVPKLKNERGSRVALCTLVSPAHCRALQHDPAYRYDPYDF